MILKTLILLVTLPGLESLVLTQDKAIAGKQGENVKISCKSDANRDYALTWYQQKPGQSPKFLLVDSTRASGLPKYLIINGVQAEDEAVYYCACHFTLTLCYTAVFGGGTEVTFDIKSPPSLVLLAPSQSLSSGDDVRVVCLVKGFRPDSATLSWSDNENAVAGTEVQTSSSQRQSDGTFIKFSTLKLSPERWSSGRTYTCHVNHLALSAPLSQSTSAEKCS
ncbi:hypothetical protein Q7C36_008245 [Tachysurus vachellii]|uniref:Ig-like domain-containing protein n=1 Tax=Tachysurus vachellii TaxID=175792 RepID=A0AA88N7R7_TACVA|nr:hypothetical protein Q7C36_008245 [Tachysurus vachellii]